MPIMYVCSAKTRVKPLANLNIRFLFDKIIYN